jgi:tyrosinase
MPLLTRYDIWDLNNGKVAGHPVQNPPGWDDISLHYAKSLQKMGFKSPPGPGNKIESSWNFSEVPNTYYFQAAQHWTPNPLTPAQKHWWDNCTHDSAATTEKYFLPWHRAYIYWYEVIIRSHLYELKGPKDWALPYWNYSLHDNDPNVPWPRSALPWVFGQAKLPDGSANPLFLPVGKRGLQPKWPTTGKTMDLSPLTPFYYQAFARANYLDFNATLDGQPHGAVHVDTGTGDGALSQTGWMASVPTAAFDPIFWLHHSEIDRFWVGWLAAGHKNPTDSTWLKASDDVKPSRWHFWHDNNINNIVTVHPGDMLDPAHLTAPFPHAYKYENLPQVPAPRPAGARAVPVAPGPSSQGIMAGAMSPVIADSGEELAVGHDPVTRSIALTSEAEPQMARLVSPTEESPKVVLHLEGVSTEGPPGNYEVYLDYPEADHQTAGSVPHYVGLVSGFGTDHHALNFRYDISDIAAQLKEQGDWQPDQVHVTFVPSVHPEAEAPVSGTLRVGRIAITAD